MNYKTLVTGAFRVNTYVFDDGKNAIVVDPGADSERIAKYAAEHGLEIKYIVVTHAHFDHVGAVGALKKMFPDVKVYMPKVDFEILENDGFISHCSRDIEIAPFSVDTAVGDGDAFVLCGHSFKTLSTPGHTAGSVCYILDDETIVSGDTLFRLGVGRTDMRYGDFKALRASLAKLFALPHDFTVLPGHGEATTLFFEREHNPYV